MNMNIKKFNTFLAASLIFSIISSNAEDVIIQPIEKVKIQPIEKEMIILSAKNTQSKDKPFDIKMGKNATIRHLKNAIKYKLNKIGITGTIEIVSNRINRPLKDTDKIMETAVVGDNVVLFKITNQMMKETPLKREASMGLETPMEKEALITESKSEKRLNLENKLQKLQEYLDELRKAVEEVK
ncbi:MAG: hypothetical protein WC436_03945 [Candidatus Babeliales bacterium]